MTRGHKSDSLVSIIINCRNSEKYIVECISSVLNQTYSNFEIIVFDNLSHDKTIQLVSQLAKKDRRIKVSCSSFELSLGKARNEAIALSMGNLISFLDSDDIWEKDKLKQQVNVIQKNKKLEYCFASTITFKDEINQFLVSKLSKENSYLKFKDPPDGYHFKKLLRNNYMSISGFMFKRKLLDQIGYFDSEFTHGEDYDFILKAALVARGKRAGIVFYRIHENNLSKSQFHTSYCETLIILEKYKKFVSARLVSSMVLFRYLFDSLKSNETKKFINYNKIGFTSMIKILIGFCVHIYFKFKK